ncbi:MAG TPA: hypothetical protein VEF04_07165, partial [Blastocatellia bacterium]|nr:hypothetical protein [Blastocatellia bacterium]
MSYFDSPLARLIQAVRRRRGLVLILRGAAITLGITAATLVITGLIANRFRYSGTALVSLRLLVVASFGAAIYFFIIHPLRRRVS